MTKKRKVELECPCDRGMTYKLCCEPYHLWQKNATDVETLMRSRYSAYALGKMDYLISTWHPSTLPQELKEGSDRLKWIELKIHAFETKLNKQEGYVRFTARFRDKNGRAQKIHETSRFIKQDQHWFYVDGVVQS